MTDILDENQDQNSSLESDDSGTAAPQQVAEEQAIEGDQPPGQGNCVPYRDLSIEIYGRSGCVGDPLDDYSRILNSAFDGAAHSARSEGETERAAQMDKAVRELNSVFVESKTPSGLVKEFAAAFKDHIDRPRTADQVERVTEQTMADLGKLYGKDFDKNLAGARRIIDELDRRMPGLKETLSSTGLGSNKTIVNQAIHLARIKGYVK